MKKIISTLALLLIVSTTAFCQTDKEYSETLKKYFEISGSNATVSTALDQMMELLKTQLPNLDEKEWGKIYKDIIEESMNEYIEMVIPIFQKYLTKSDLEEMIKFYQTPIGQKFYKSNTSITKDVMSISQEWGMKLSEKLMETIQKANEE